MEDGCTTGLFGKLPAHGDFVRRALPRSFIGPWDDWLSAGIEASRHDLGPAWDRAWEEAPAWRFRLAPGACGPDAAVGVVVTSADTVGRRFPLTLAAVLPSAAIPPPEDWFDALEAAAWQGRAGDVDADRLFALLPAPPPDDPDATLDGRSLFWTAGTPPRRMPEAADFAGLLGGDGAPLRAAAGLPFVTADIQAEAGPDALPPEALPPEAGVPEPLPFTEAATEAGTDAAAGLLWLEPADGPGEPEATPAPASEPYVWAETVDLPWAPAPPDTKPHDPEAGAAA